MDLSNIDPEQLVGEEGLEYKVTTGSSGLQLNLKDCPEPRCRSHDWKVYINADTGLGKCHRCDTGFNLFKLIQLTRNLSTPNTFRYFESVADRFRFKPKIKFVSKKLNIDWNLPLNSKIEVDDDLPAYLKDRGINAKIAKRFDLRVCNNGFYRYTDNHDRVRFVDFSNRIIIPVYDSEGKLVTFQGRDITGVSSKKYLFPNGLAGTGRFIYNSNYALKNKAKKVILNEGVFDVFSATIAVESDVLFSDFTACGTFGKNLSIQNNQVALQDQLSDLLLLKQNGTDEFIMMWDGEQKAYLAAVKAAIALSSYGLHTTVAKLPADKDPNECTVDEVLDSLDRRAAPSKMDLVRARLLDGYR